MGGGGRAARPRARHGVVVDDALLDGGEAPDEAEVELTCPLVLQGSGCFELCKGVEIGNGFASAWLGGRGSGGGGGLRPAVKPRRAALLWEGPGSGGREGTPKSRAPAP